MRINLQVTALLLSTGFGLRAADRITVPVDPSRTAPLRGQVHRLAQARYDQGLADPATPIGYATLFLQPSAGLDAFLNTFTPARKLTPEQFADRFGLSRNDIAKVTAWLSSQGLQVHDVARGRHWITFSGTAAQVGRALHTEFHRYTVNGVSHFANATDPEVPLALQGVVAGFGGLNDFLPSAPVHSAEPEYNVGTSHYLAPGDLATIYDLTPLYNLGNSGAGQTIVVVGQSELPGSDIASYRRRFGLPTGNPLTVLAGNDPGVVLEALAEADLDLEISGAVAPQAAQVYVYSTDFTVALQYAVDQNLGEVINVSYGFCEGQSPQYFRNVVQQANAQGITVVVAAGDAGAATCDSSDPTPQASSGVTVSFPASYPEVTAVGGTEFNEGSGSYWQTAVSSTGGTAKSYILETPWNDSSVTTFFEAGGGGPSALFPKPAWQTGPGVPQDNARDLPDVSFSASPLHDPYATIFEGVLFPVGGTSTSSPLFAGVVALLNEYAVSQGALGAPGLGNINPSLYAAAQSAPNSFHDVTSGNNDVACVQSTPSCVDGEIGFNAGPGYDLATGLGSLDIFNFVTQWKPGVVPAVSLSVSPGSAGLTDSVQLTAAVTGSGAAPSGAVSFLLDAGGGLGSIALGTVNLVAGSAAGSSTATFSTNGTQLAPGNGSIQAVYSGDAIYQGAQAMAAFTLKPPASSGSMVIPFVTPNPVPDTDGIWRYTVGLTEVAGVATTVTSFTIDGLTEGTSVLTSANIAANGTVYAQLIHLGLTATANRLFLFQGRDADGTVWTQQLTVPFLIAPSNVPAPAISLTTAAPLVPQNTAGAADCQWSQQLTVQEQGGFETLLEGFLINGASVPTQIQTTFGATRLAPYGVLQGSVCAPGPGPAAFTISGLSDSGSDASPVTGTVNSTLAATAATAQFTAPAPASTYTLPVPDASHAPAPVSIPVNFSGGSPAWSVMAGPVNSATTWLSVKPVSGTGSGSVTVSADPTGLSPGAYTAYLTFASASAAQTVSVPVTLIVGASIVGASNNVTVAGITNNFSGGLIAAPGMMTAVYGSNMAPGGTSLSAQGLPLPLSLAGVSATVNGVTAPLYYVSPGQIDLQIPYETSAGTAILAINNSGQVATFPITVAVTAPGLYPSAVSNSSGLAVSSAPIGSTLLLFMTGEGDVTPTLPTGVTPNPSANANTYPKPRLPVTVSIGGVDMDVLFQAIPYGLVGATQIDFTIPTNAPTGPQQLVVGVGGVQAPPVNLTVTAH